MFTYGPEKKNKKDRYMLLYTQSKKQKSEKKSKPNAKHGKLFPRSHRVSSSPSIRIIHFHPHRRKLNGRKNTGSEQLIDCDRYVITIGR